ncbi:hypothetical protein I4U23_030568 [Adineta vaga]|nr:hypothetical protein I4U23_030568 [Adineta vaga]
MWICRLISKGISSAKLAAVCLEKNKLQAFVANLISSGKFSGESDVLSYESSSLFDCTTYFQHFSSVITSLPLSTSFGEMILVTDKIPSTMKLLEG